MSSAFPGGQRHWRLPAIVPVSARSARAAALSAPRAGAAGRRPSRVLAALAAMALLALATAAAPVRAAEGEESPEQLRQRLADRLKDDVSTLKLSPARAKASGRDAPEVRARRAPAKAPAPALSASAAAALVAPDAHWSYAGEDAPDRWGQMQPGWRQCAIGTRQSPIDIRDTIRVDQEAIGFDYRPSRFAVVDNGHTIQVDVAPGNTMEIMGRRYELQQFHFHRPSEERINGRQYDMVAHLVHKDAQGRLAVIAVLLERGHDHALIQTIWNHLPLERGERYEAPVAIDLGALLPKDRGYYTYMGSLTTPPCSEGVLWMVFRQPVQLSDVQISVFSRLYPMNARPLQAASGRLIKESN